MNDVTDKDKGEDYVVNELRQWTADSIDGATEIGFHWDNPDEHDEVVEKEEDKEHVRINSEENAKGENSTTNSEESPQPLY